MCSRLACLRSQEELSGEDSEGTAPDRTVEELSGEESEGTGSDRSVEELDDEEEGTEDGSESDRSVEELEEEGSEGDESDRSVEELSEEGPEDNAPDADLPPLGESQTPLAPRHRAACLRPRYTAEAAAAIAAPTRKRMRSPQVCSEEERSASRNSRVTNGDAEDKGSQKTASPRPAESSAPVIKKKRTYMNPPA